MKFLILTFALGTLTRPVSYVLSIIVSQTVLEIETTFSPVFPLYDLA